MIFSITAGTNMKVYIRNGGNRRRAFKGSERVCGSRER